MILCRSELAVQFRAMINWSWFAGRMVLVEIETEQEVGNFGMMHSKINSDHEARLPPHPFPQQCFYRTRNGEGMARAWPDSSCCPERFGKSSDTGCP